MKYSAHLRAILLDRTNPGSHVAIGPYRNRAGDVRTTIETPLEGIRGGQKGLCIFWGGAKDGTWSPEHGPSACHQCTAYRDEPIGVLGKETWSICPMCPPIQLPGCWEGGAGQEWDAPGPYSPCPKPYHLPPKRSAASGTEPQLGKCIQGGHCWKLLDKPRVDALPSAVSPPFLATLCFSAPSPSPERSGPVPGEGR